jgi:hypothetical protein
MSVIRLRSGILAVAAAVFVAGCASMGGPSFPAVAGEYTGGVSVEGQGIDGTFEIMQDGPRLQATFDAPSFGLTAEGEGTLAEDGSARIFLDYDLQCPGRAEMVGSFSEDGTRFSGTIAAADCTGEIGGTFSFSR